MREIQHQCIASKRLITFRFAQCARATSEKCGVRRTQIYLSEVESEVLEREAKKTGRTRSQLIRDAIGARYLKQPAAGALEAALLESAGAWKGAARTTGQDYVEGQPAAQGRHSV